MKRIRLPKGYSFRIKQSDYSNAQNISIFFKGHEVGRLRLSGYSKEYRTHSWLLEEHQCKGLGALMYARAIKWALDNNFKISSSGCTSKEAARVWSGRTIRKYFKIIRYTVNGNALWRAYKK